MNKKVNQTSKVTKVKKAILTATTFLTMMQFTSSHNIPKTPLTEQNRPHLEAIQGTGTFYPITYSQGISDLEELAGKREKEDAFVYLPNTGWIDVGFRKTTNKNKTSVDINLINIVTQGYDYAIRFHFHPQEKAPPSVADFDTFKSTKKYMTQWFNNYRVIHQVVDASKIKWTYGLDELNKSDRQILEYVNKSNKISNNTHTKTYFSIIRAILGRSEYEKVVEEEPSKKLKKFDDPKKQKYYNSNVLLNSIKYKENFDEKTALDNYISNARKMGYFMEYKKHEK